MYRLKVTPSKPHGNKMKIYIVWYEADYFDRCQKDLYETFLNRGVAVEKMKSLEKENPKWDFWIEELEVNTTKEAVA